MTIQQAIQQTEENMQEYYGTKRINAQPMTRQAYNDLRGWTLPNDECGDDEGYLVEYLDGGKPNVEGYAGYISWSPREQFELAYRPTTAMNFGHALEALKAGFGVTRAAWGEGGCYIEGENFPTLSNEDLFAEDWQAVTSLTA